MIENFDVLQKYNFWDGTYSSLGLKRSSYLKKIKLFTGNKLIKVMVGQRRAGKSYLMRQVMQMLITENNISPKNICYINKEIVEFDFIRNYNDLGELIAMYKTQVQAEGKIYLFIDEIQNIEGWERLINSYAQNYVDAYEIFISGSNSQLLSGELASLLSGRYIEFLVLPFSFQEYCELKQSEISKKSFLEYLQTGGMPELFHLPNDETKRHYISSVKDTILLRDIVQRYGIKDARLLEDIFAYLVNNASNLLSINNIINYFDSRKRKTNYETVSTYIEYLRRTFLVHKVERYNIKGKEIISGNHKYYTNDVSYKNYLYSGFDYGVGWLLENIVYLQLIQNGFSVYTGVSATREIDFVAIKDDRVLYLQVAYILSEASTIDREYKELSKIGDNYEKYVVSLDDLKLPAREGIKHCQAWLLNEVL